MYISTFLQMYYIPPANGYSIGAEAPIYMKRKNKCLSYANVCSPSPHEHWFFIKILGRSCLIVDVKTFPK